MAAETLVYSPVQERNEGSAFRIEYDHLTTDGEIWDDVVSYLGEYRFQIPKYSYNLQYSHGQDGLRIRDLHRGESMHQKAQKALNLRYEAHLNALREEAEVLAIANLEDVLRFSKSGDKIVWASPPGNASEGYGDYGFVYYGEIDKNEQDEANLAMTALRVEGNSLAPYNSLFSTIIDDHQEFSTPEQFISSPMVVRDIDKEDLIKEIKKVFGEQEHDNETFKKTINHMGGVIRSFIQMVRNSSKEEKKTAFNALENYALEVKRRIEHNITLFPVTTNEQLAMVINGYGYEPPQVRGSCGLSGSKTPNIMKFMISSIVGEDEHGSLQFECPHCGSVNTRNRGKLLSHCQSCDQDVRC